MSLVLGQDVCEICGELAEVGQELRRMSAAGSIDDMGRIRHTWRHVSCEAVPASPVVDVEAPPWAGWFHDLASDPYTVAERLHELEQRVATLEAKR
jgi:hypothetical protein